MSLTRVLPYTLNRLLEGQRAQLTRDQGATDRWGAQASSDWQPLATVRCLHWFQKEGGRGPAKLFAVPQREIAESEGGLLLPAGTDITERDRVANITDPEGNVLIPGPFDVIAVFDQGDHVEVAWKRATEARVSA